MVLAKIKRTHPVHGTPKSVWVRVAEWNELKAEGYLDEEVAEATEAPEATAEAPKPRRRIRKK